MTVSVEFSAAHRLAVDERGAEWNERVYGPCSRPGGHGHSYVVEATVLSRPDATTGLAVDERALRALVEERIAIPCRLKHLNHDVDFLAGVNPTAENLAGAFAGRLLGKLERGRLRRLTVRETPRNAATWREEEGR